MSSATAAAAVAHSAVTRGFSFSFSHRGRARNQRNYEQRRDKSSPKYTSIYAPGAAQTTFVYSAAMKEVHEEEC